MKVPLHNRRGTFMSHLSEMNFYSAEIGTNAISLFITLQVAGLHRVRPSTTLDKSKYFILYKSHYYSSFLLIKSSI